MIHWSLQAVDLWFFQTLHLFFLFGAFCWFVWMVRLGASARYRPFRGEVPDLAVSVLVPSYREEIEVLEANLAEMLRHTSPRDEVLLLMDERDPNRQRGELPVEAELRGQSEGHDEERSHDDPAEDRPEPAHHHVTGPDAHGTG